MSLATLVLVSPKKGILREPECWVAQPVNWLGKEDDVQNHTQTGTASNGRGEKPGTTAQWTRTMERRVFGACPGSGSACKGRILAVECCRRDTVVVLMLKPAPTTGTDVEKISYDEWMKHCKSRDRQTQALEERIADGRNGSYPRRGAEREG